MIAFIVFFLTTQDAPDLDRLAAAGRVSAERLGTRQATWTATHTLESGISINVHMARQGDRQSVALKAADQDLGRLIIRDGVWYVSDPLGHRKHRPNEATFFIPTWYLYLQEADPQFITDGLMLKDVPFEGRIGEVGVWRQPLPEAMRRQLQTTLDQMNAAKIDRPDVTRKLRDLLEKGIVFRVHLQTGLIEESQNAKMRTRISDVMILEKPDPRLFEIPTRQWVDLTDDPLKGNLEDLAMLANSPAWRRGQPAGDMTLGLMDVGTGRFRRLPFDGAAALAGCFSRNRRRAYVTGLSQEGVFGLYEVDLSSGRNRRLAHNLEANGHMAFPVLSPDGRSLAVLHGGGERRLLENDVALVDIETGQARYLGRPADRAFLSWMSDGRSLILLERSRVLEGEAEAHWICRMGLDGKVTRIREGDQPTLFGDGKTVLFQRRDRSWATCDTEGENESVFGDGRKSYGFPSPAPDGKRMIMMKFRPDRGPEPVVIDIATGEERVIRHSDGLWGQPAWR